MEMEPLFCRRSSLGTPQLGRARMKPSWDSAHPGSIGDYIFTDQLNHLGRRLFLNFLISVN
jgi:hypothetical protein